MQWQITDNIIARTLVIADARSIFTTVNDNRNYLREWLPWLDFNTSVIDSRNFIREAIQGYSDGSSLHIGLWNSVDNTCIGICGFHTIRDGVAKFGYWLDSGWQGKGIIYQVCSVLLQHIFATGKVHEVLIQAATANARSRVIAEKLGFKLKEIVPDAEWLYDHYVDHAVYSITLDEAKA